MKAAVIVEVDLASDVEDYAFTRTVSARSSPEARLMDAILKAAKGEENPPAPACFKIVGKGVTIEDVKRFVDNPINDDG